ncbi:class I poly(R)-hydroxyalkanoic acid synthase [Halioxenophilus sp. WMMB6]|uniref:PHA/PHB synthase family protein n=1 Tax=Halioxenophilus sp. WMMB6 TaxID=3073815 RepID=UPI00295E2FF9|nr:class I poly(R)-hydroxyalkanoic acid synthase [Halioxenophilus sp. WMMB6]
MEQGDQKEILRYIDKYRGMFNELSHEIMMRFLAGGKADINPLTNADKVMGVLSRGVKVDPSKLMQEQMRFLESQMSLWQSTAKALMESNKPETVVEAERSDKRFKDEQWDTNPMFNYFKQAYLLNSRMMQNFVDSLEFEDQKTAEQVKFFARQYINSLSPSNYVFTNPEVCRDILDTEGECLARGMDNFLRDLENSPLEAFKIGQVNVDAFEVGKDLAITPGKVVYQNRMFQLIQYQPTTEQVYKKPLLIVAPFINKFYILDLDQQKSMIRWLTSQGYSVFLMSWVNPDESYRDVTFDAYVVDGVLKALDVTSEISQSKSVNALGYCIGGTVLGIAAAVLKKQGSRRLHSMTLLTTLFEFSEAGEAGNYISDQTYPLVEQSAQTKGYFDGRILAYCFSMLRENSLFWSYFVDNYLKGKDPMPFDILYWNSDSTNIPAKAFLYYLRKTYMDNQLKEPGGVVIDGVEVDLSLIDIPSYSLATSNDHIVIWQAAYESVQLLKNSNARFVLAGSGHVAGVVNPPETGKYPHWVNKKLDDSPEQWLANATQVDGSWWTDWNAWLAPLSGAKKAAPSELGNSDYPPIEDAPGSYVKVRLEKITETEKTSESSAHG